MVPSSNSGKGRYYFYSQVIDGGLGVTCIDCYVAAINNYVLERVAPFIGPGCRAINSNGDYLE